MKKLRILVLLYEEAVPPEDIRDIPKKERGWFQTEYDVVSTLRELGHDVRPVGLYDDLQALRTAIQEHQAEIAFNILEEFHGQSELDQHVVSYLELLKLRYTGCNPRGLTLARDKALTKKILAYHRIPVPRFQVFPIGRKVRRQRRLAFPVLVKSLIEEGSVGISRASVVHTDAELVERVDFVHRRLETDVIAEEYIDGRELYVGLLGNERVQALPVWEMRFENLPEGAPNIATLKVKWDEEHQKKLGVKLGRARGLAADEERAIQELSRRVYKVLGLSGYARLDLRLRADGRVFLIEANPNPQIAKDGEFAASAHAAGIDYPELLQRILNLGLGYRRHFLA